MTSTGAQGGVLATPILHHPQVAILGVHEVKKKPAVVDDQIVIRELGNLSLSLDHRVVDGAVGADFLYARDRAARSTPAAWLSGRRSDERRHAAAGARPRGRAVGPAPEIPARRPARACYRHMLKMRVLDQRMLSLQRQGRIGFYGTATGQEAAVTGSAYRAARHRLGVPGAARDGRVAVARHHASRRSSAS